MKIQQLASELSDAKFDLEVAISHGAMVNRRKEMLRNLLENRLPDIMEALDNAAKLEQTNEALSREVEDSDAELQEKDQEIKELREKLEEAEAAVAKKTGKKKTAGDEAGGQ